MNKILTCNLVVDIDKEKKNYYEESFNWDLDDIPETSCYMVTPKGPIGTSSENLTILGRLPGIPADLPGQIVYFTNVENVQEEYDQAITQDGAKGICPPFNYQWFGGGCYAIYEDSDGKWKGFHKKNP